MIPGTHVEVTVGLAKGRWGIYVEDVVGDNTFAKVELNKDSTHPTPDKIVIPKQFLRPLGSKQKSPKLTVVNCLAKIFGLDKNDNILWKREIKIPDCEFDMDDPESYAEKIIDQAVQIVGDKWPELKDSPNLTKITGGIILLLGE